MKTNIRISAVLSAVAVGIVSYANATISPWFDAGISNYDFWPTDGSNVSIAGQGTWSGTTNATLEASSPKALAINTDGEGRLTFTAETQVDAAASNAVYSATMTFPGGPDLDALDDPGEGIKAGLAVATTNGVLVFCGRAKDPEGSTNIWVALSGATPVVDVSTAVQVSLKTEGEVLKAQYAVNGTVLTYENSEWIALASADKILNGSKFAGTGFNLSALSATTDDGIVVTATLTLPELPENVSGVSVTTNGVAIEGVEGVYTVVQGDSVTVTFVAAEGYAFSGDSSIVLVMDSDKTLNQDDIPAAAALNSFIKINEIMASNPSVDKGGITNDMGIAEMDWIELYNAASVDIDITGWYLSDNDKKGKEDKATILGSCVIPAGGYKIVWLDKIHTNATEYAANEAFAVLKLSSSGDLIQLADKNKTVVDKINFKDKPQIKGYSYGPGKVSYGPNAGTGPYVYMKTATPGAANVTEGWGDFTPAVTFSEPHGYKTESFELTLSCANMPDFEGAGIYYTLDGTSPTPASTLYTGPITIDKTTCVRAAVPVEGSILQFDASATYIFLDDVLAEARSGTAPASAVGFPDDNAVNNQEMLYGMEQSIVTGSDRDRLLRGFTNSIATLSIVVDPSNLFNSAKGIYVNPRGEGEEWERQIMLEGFDPTGVGADFAQPAGIRIRGGNSRNTGKPKHSLRFFFRSSYGVSSLAAKMFVGEPLSLNGEGKMKEEIGEYDKLDLRTSQNLSWANENSANDTFVTEVFSRDSQRDLGQPYTRSRYYNLFINGQYWGLYQTQERGDEHWGESYLGGDSLQYDLIKTASTFINNKLSYSIECNEGTWDAWSNLWHIATQEGFAGDYTNNYNRVLGLNPDGTRNLAYPILLNAKSLMVYMLVSHYVVDQDGPTSPFSSIDKGHANNFYAIRNRDDAGTVNGFVFLRHDAEMSMGQNSNTGAAKNPTFWGTENQTDPSVPVGGSTDPSGLGVLKFRTIPYFTPAELHYLLMQNPTYKRQYADLFYKECLREGGAMTVEKATERYTSRMAEIDDAIVCEAARWGKSKNRTTWLNACKTSTTFITNRLDNMKSQYQANGVNWYPTVQPPYVTDADGVRYFDGGEVPYQEKVYLLNNEADGTLYYTIDGTDPADSGIEYTAPFSIPDSGATVRARLFKDDEWSALEEVALEMDIPNDQRYGIRVAEILNAAVNDPADEFIVLTNTLDKAVSLEGLSIWSEKAGQTLVKLAELGAGVELAAGGTIKLTQPANWIGDTKLKNGDIYVELRDFNGKRIQNARVDSGTWFPTGEFNDKGKEIHACDKTGRWFIALEFLGDTDGGEVTLESQWMPSPEPEPEPTIPLPEDATAKDEVLSVITNNAAVEEWYVGISTNSVDGYISITNFTGNAEAVELCYLLNNDVLDASVTTNAAVELKIPEISFDPTTGHVIVDGALLIHNSEVTRTVNGDVRLYYADSLEALETSTDYLQISPPSFPVEKDAGTTVNIPARFYRLKIE